MSAAAQLDANRRARLPTSTWLAAAAVVILVTLIVLPSRWRSSSAAAPISTTPSGQSFVPVARGPLVRTIRVGGTLAALHFAGVSAPQLRGARFQLTLITLAEAGSHVKEGDVVAEFDRQAQKSSFEDHEAEVNSQNDAILKRKGELKIEREKQLSDLQKAQADVETAKLENRRNEVVSKIDAEKNQQALKEAEATLKMQEQTLQLRQASADAEIRLLEIKRDREKLAADQARANYERLIVKTPVAGMVVLQPFWKQGRVGPPQEGDQVWPGMVFMQVVDNSSMVILSRINQLDAKMLSIGAPAEVHLDAYPDLTLHGTVEHMSPIAQMGNFSGVTRTFQVTFAIQGTDPRLIPDISASADVELERIPDALLVPRSAVTESGSLAGSGAYVLVQNGTGVSRREVKVAAASDLQCAIQSGLREGEMVAAKP